jgi:prepilin-type N-terminal cleavage/methylation domain-containing protein
VRVERERAAGFSLIEVLVALALGGVVLLVAGGFYWQQVRISERLAASRRADAELENAYEELRASHLPLVSGPLYETEDGIALEALVGPSDTPDLERLTLLARYRVRGEQHERRIEALAYAP